MRQNHKNKIECVAGTFITVINVPTLTGMDPIAQTIYIWLCHHADKKGRVWECWPSIQTLSRESGACENTVKAKIRILEMVGLVKKVIKKNADGTNQTNRYYLNTFGCVREKRDGSTNDPSSSVIDPSAGRQIATNKNQFDQKSKNKNEREGVCTKSSSPYERNKKFFQGGSLLQEELIDYWCKTDSLPRDKVKKMMQEFILYWTELDWDGEKQKWEYRRHFDVNTRFSSWISKENSFNKSKSKDILEI